MKKTAGGYLMCNIAGYVGIRPAAPILIEMIRRQEGLAGGYYTGRHVVNAVRKVINDQTVPRETLLDYNKTINDEIKKKRAEFGLD
jgi:hypothetical protein